MPSHPQLALWSLWDICGNQYLLTRLLLQWRAGIRIEVLLLIRAIIPQEQVKPIHRLRLPEGPPTTLGARCVGLLMFIAHLLY